MNNELKSLLTDISGYLEANLRDIHLIIYEADQKAVLKEALADLLLRTNRALEEIKNEKQ